MPPPPSPWSKNATHNYNPKNDFPGLSAPPAAPAVEGKSEYQSRQDDELEALRSIFMDDFIELDTGPGAWKKSADRAFKLRLTANSDPDTTVILSVTMTATYPRTAPLLALGDMESIPQASRQKIHTIVEHLPKTLLGSEMIFSIATPIQDVLEDAVEAKAAGQEVPSLEEERVQKEAAAVEAEMVRQAEAEKETMKSKREEDRMLQRMVHEERQRQKDRLRDSRRKSRQAEEHENFADIFIADTYNQITFDQTSTIQDDDAQLLSFRAVTGGVTLSQGPVTNVSIVQPAALTGQSHSCSLILKQADIVDRTLQDGAFKSQIIDLEQEMEALKRFRDAPHTNVLNVVDFKVNRESNETQPNAGVWKICVLTEYGNKGSMTELLDLVGTISLDNVRAWTIQLLEALEFYHRNGIVHRLVHVNNVLFTRPRSGGTVIKLSDGGFQRRLYELRDPSAVLPSHSAARSTYWTAPELTHAKVESYTRKTDVWDFGVVFLQMVFGLGILEKYTSPDALLGSMNLSAPSEDFIRKLFKADQKKRPSAFELLASEFLRSNDPLIDSSIRPDDSHSSQQPSVGSQRPLLLGHPSGTDTTTFSRYANEFHEVSRLGKGGFGEVFKARNKLDGQLYAIKKITQRSAGLLSEVVSETMLLSRLNHPFVVRYFNAWHEEEPIGFTETDEDTFSSAEESSFITTDGPSIDFGQSTGGLDFISSTGPQIQFGYDSDEDSGTDEEDVVSPGDESRPAAQTSPSLGGQLELKRTRSSTRIQRQVRTTLYIQMEYCEKHTLRNLIMQGLHDRVDEGWRLLRQIVEGLNYIHGQGIIHRDLKPDNIFIDLTSTPRIGDFGLATSGKYYTADQSSSTLGQVDNDLTRSIGTALYVAPELRSNVTSHYNEKVDTLMERDALVRALREKKHTLPTEFQKPEKAVQGEIVLSLLSHRASDRPSASELLRSGKLPVLIEDETIRQAVRGLSDSNSPYYRKMMSALFSQPPELAKDYAWDMGSITRHGPNDLLLQATVKETLSSVFRRHGAVEATRPLVFPKSSYYLANAVQLLDSSGNLLQLPYDLTLPYARQIAKQAPLASKTFAFGSVYRDAYTGGPPRSHGEVDFDIVSTDTLDLSLKEAEVLKVVNEVIDAFPSLESAQMVFHLNHSDLLELIMEFCRIPEPKRPAVKEIISKLNVGQWTWQKIRNELRAPSLGVWSTSLDDLECFDFRDVPHKAFEKLRQLFHGTDYVEKSAPIFAHLNTVAGYADEFNIQRKIYVSPLSSFNDKFYRGGILFQCLFDSKSKDVFAAGGRYDRLIEDHRPTRQGQPAPCRAVGFSLGWEKLFTSMSRFQKSTSKAFLKKTADEIKGQWISRRCDALVASFDAAVLRSVGLSLLRQLWANDISAELAIDVRSPEELLSHYKDDRHSWIIIIKQDPGSQGDRVLKVKSMVRKDETDVRSSQLLGWLRSEIRERDQREGVKDRAKLARKTSAQATGPSSAEGEQDVRVLFPTFKGKRGNRRFIVEAAHNRASDLVQSFLDGPIAAVDVKDDVLDTIRDTSLADPDAWRRLIQSAPLTERKYLQHVHELLSDLARENKGATRNAFVYNYRTGGCIYYDLGRGV
ncbi:MAG: hypothetical protein M1833_000048 [Piccolia ochrophora]|nr:MAG: hypothetical protein M1833_000048 [Piccolia ochrophora]